MSEQAKRIDLTREAPFFLGDVEVRPALREIASREKRETLEPRVMQVLTALARRRDEIVTRDELIAACWENRAVGDDAINRSIGKLRRVAEAFGAFSLETIPRVGYRLTASMPLSEQSVPSLKVSLPTEVLGFWNRRSRLAVSLSALMVILAGLTFWAVHAPPHEIVVRAPVRHLIAVLPFTPQSAGENARLLGDRVASTIAETLTKTGEPVVLPADSFQYRGAAKARAARELHAMYVIDGEVVQEKGRVRVSVHFDDAVRGTTVFARTFEDSADRAETLPDRVAAYIASVTWGSDVTHWSERSAPAMLRAFEQQKSGDFFAAYETARAMAQADPGNADVQRIYASDVVNLIYASPAARKQDLLAEARRAAERAIALRPWSGEAYAVFTSTTPHFLWAEREGYLRRALSLTPGSIGVAEYLTWLLNDTGRFREADSSARSAYERFPYHVTSQQRQVEQQLGTGNAAAALQILPRARRLWPDEPVFFDLTFEALALQQSPYDAVVFLRDPDVRAKLPATKIAHWNNVIRALSSRRAADIAVLARDCANPGDNWWSCMIALAKLGRIDEAYRIANEAYQDQRAADRNALVEKWLANPELPSTRYLFIPATAAMRADPRFRELAERTGLLQYWQSARRPPDFCASERAPICALLS